MAYENRYTGFGGLQSMQVTAELMPFIDFMKQNGVKRYLEIGLAHGIMFHAVGSALGAGAQMVGVDLNDPSQWAADPHYHEPAKPSVERAIADLEIKGVSVGVFWGDSHDPDMVKHVKPYAPFDLCFIDADHTYDGAMQDWNNYGPMATKFVAFHDIESDFGAGDGGPMAAWLELKAKYPKSIEFTTHVGMGIGVIIR